MERKLDSILLAATFAVAGALPTWSQIAYVIKPAAPGQQRAILLPTAQFPVGFTGGAPPLPGFWASAIAPGFAEGGHAIDQTTRRAFSTDGLRIVEETLDRYTPGPAPTVPIPAPLLTPGSGISGLAVDASSGTLWMCNHDALRAFSTTWPYAPTGPVLTFSFDHSQMSGLGFEPSTGSLWACDVQGMVYEVDPATGGLLSSPVSLSSGPALLTGLAVNTSNGPGSYSPAPCGPGGLAGDAFHIAVTDGVNVYDALGSALIPVGGGGPAYGLAFSSDGQYSHGGSAGACTGTQPYIRMSAPLAGAAPRIRVEAACPASPALLLAGTCPLNPGIPICGGNVRVNTWMLPAVTDAIGNADFPMPALPPGFEVTMQWAINEGGGGCPWVFTDALTVTAGMP